MSSKALTAALVWIPSEPLALRVQEIRLRHDRHAARWMPHITLLFPFRPLSELPAVRGTIEEVCGGLRPFPVRLDAFRWFPSSRTVWLVPEPSDPVAEIQRRLQEAFPDCDDVSRHASGYVPHLSVGQCPDGSLAERLGPGWEPAEADFGAISFIWRKDEPADPFREGERFALGPAAPNPH